MRLSGIEISRKPRYAVAAAALAIAALWLFLTRDVFIDDTFIHLHFGEMLNRYGMLTADGQVASFPSSPGYTVIAAIAAATADPALAMKAVSSAAYLALLLVVLYRWCVARPSPADWPGLLWIMVLASPMATRWLTDGMETGVLGLCAVLLGAGFRVRPAASERGSLATFLLLVMAGAGLALLRIETLCMIGWVLLFAVVRDWPEGRPEARRLPAQVLQLARRHGHLAIGAAAVVLTYLLWFGHLVPDTAVAKKVVTPWDTAYLIVHATGASMSLGIGLWLVAGISTLLLLWAGWRRGGRAWWLALLAAAMLPLTLLLIVGAQQQVQAIRHILWLFLFCNSAMLLLAADLSSSLAPPRWLDGRAKTATLAVAAAMLAFWVYEAQVVARVSRNAAAWIADYRAIDWSPLAGRQGIAFDVGLPLFHSNGRICDGSGLINGRAAAKRPMEQRLADCLAQSPDFLIVTAWQLAAVVEIGGQPSPLADWRICARLGQRGARVRESRSVGQLLIVATALAATLCPEAIGRLGEDGTPHFDG